MTARVPALLLGAVALLAVSAAWALDAEAPPADQTKIRFQKTLFVHKATSGKVFSETRRIKKGDVLWKILAKEYGIAARDIPSLVETYREVNPGLDPNVLKIGQVIRVPFKVESEVEPPAVAQAAPEGTHLVRSGDTLWKVLRDEYGVSRDGMAEAIRTVKNANPDLRDPDRLWLGQALSIPFKQVRPPQAPAAAAPPPASARAAEEPGEAGLPEQFLSVAALLESMGCKVDRTGVLYLPLARGRTLRLEGSDFPLLESPTGKRVILDPRGRLTDALRDAIVSVWGYPVVRAVPADAQRYLEILIPLMGFHQITEGARTLPTGEGTAFAIQARWTVAPTQEALARSALHVIFPPGAAVDPLVATLARRKGLALHFLGTTPSGGEQTAGTEEPPVLADADEVEGASVLLEKLGVSYQLSPLISCDLGGNVVYQVRPPLTFVHGGISYAVPPAAPPKAEDLLVRAGYFTFGWAPEAPTMGRIGDLLRLIGVENRDAALELPGDGALRLRIEGLAVRSPTLAASLSPGAAAQPPLDVFLTKAKVEPEGTALMRKQGYLPWVVR